MKKFMMGFILAAILFCGISFAEEGYYQLIKVNYPIIVAGQELKSDLPTLNYNGTTYLPLRKVSEATGAMINWDNSAGQVKIEPQVKEVIKEVPKEVIKEVIKEVPKEVIKTEYVEDTQKLQKAKDITVIMSGYLELSIASNSIDRASNNLYVYGTKVINGITTEKETTSNQVSDGINSAVKDYNNALGFVKLCVPIASKYGFDISDMDKTLASQNAGISYLKEAYKKMGEYDAYKIQDDFNSALKNLGYYSNERITPFPQYTKYFQYSQMIQAIS